MKKIITMFRIMYNDYTLTSKKIKVIKRKVYKRAIGHLCSYVWNIITAPFIYPIWYIFRNRLDQNWMPNQNATSKEILYYDIKCHLRPLRYWLWTYGDLHDPLGRGGMPNDYRNGKNTFINRWWYSAIRNPRFTYNFVKYKTADILHTKIVFDTRTDITIHSYGIGNLKQGIVYAWFIADTGDMYFVYEHHTDKSIFYFGWVGLLNKDGNTKGRFEIAYRIK